MPRHDGAPVGDRPERSGFSLIEMLTALAIVGILLAIAVASYDSSSSVTRRQVATTCLDGLAAALERERASTFSYPAGPLPRTACVDELQEHYRFAGTVEAEQFRLTAEPLGRQARADGACNCTLVLDHTGRRGTAAGDPACAADARVAACW